MENIWQPLIYASLLNLQLSYDSYLEQGHSQSIKTEIAVVSAQIAAFFDDFSIEILLLYCCFMSTVNI